ncbi:MAG: cytochrome C assembly protein [Actinobacteria bacterium]|nr:MAG: cytochrome C assembly protein [Actinomycetota bacterium]
MKSRADIPALLSLAIGGLLTTAAFLMAFFYAPVQMYEDLFHWDVTFQIFYFHVPVAESSFLVFTFAMFFAIRYLMTRDRKHDTRSRLGMELTLIFVILTMITGDLWTKARWNVWWQWEPRLTTYFIMTLLVVGYFVLRGSVEDEERRATFSAVFAIFAWIDAPVSFIITRVMQDASSHPIVFENGGLAETPAALVTFIVAQIGMLCLAFAIYRMRMREEHLKERLEAAKIALGG